MEESIFKRIGKRIRSLFRKELSAKEPEEPQVCQMPEEESPAVQESGESISVDAAPAEDLESRWTQEYVQFLEETDGGLPQSEAKAEAPEPEDTEDPAEEEAPEPEDTGDPAEAEAPEPEDTEAETYTDGTDPQDPEEKKETEE